MKARLVYYEGGIQLLIATGKIVTVTMEAAKEFLMNFDREDYYADSGTWDYENLTNLSDLGLSEGMYCAKLERISVSESNPTFPLRTVCCTTRPRRCC